ncbi:MAG TPA: hypothetical protein VFI24_28050 [Pyrinomonadaceae bacterium]|nr:hypothetical protein [Pyrinomonadaceae bacterium]
MKSFFPTTLIILCLVSGGAVLTNAQTRQQDQGPMTNSEVVKLVKAGFKDKTIVLIISSRIPNFELTSDKMIQLKRSGVSENLIVAMLARQEGTDVPLTDDEWGDDPFFNSKVDPKGNGNGNGGTGAGSGSPSDGSTNIFGSSAGGKSSVRTRTGNGGSSGDSQLSGSATVRILRPPTEGGSGNPAKLEKTKSLTNESIVELVEAGFSEGTIIRRIEQSPVEFDLAADKVEELRKRRVTDKVLAAMKAAMGDDK